MNSESAKVPSHFHEIDHARTALQATKFFLLWVTPATFSYAVFLFSWPLWLKIPVIGALAIIAAHGLQCVSLLGHEGTHFALHRDRWKSAVWGVVLSCFTPFHQDVGFAVTHAEHHAFTNTDRDPDHIFFRRFKNFFSRLFLARIAASNRYLHTTLLLALNRWPADRSLRTGLTLAQMTHLARINLAVSGGLLLVYIALTVFFPVFMIFLLWLPFVLVVLISGLRPYIEHLETQSGRGFDSRSWISPVFDALYGSINYHQAHHLWPRVPSYKLKELHQWMKANGVGIDYRSQEIHSIFDFVKIAAK